MPLRILSESTSIKTYRRWQRQKRAGREPGRVGRPRVKKSLGALMRDFTYQYAGPMVLTPGRKILRRIVECETAPAEAKAVKDVAPGADKTQPPQAGRVKRSIAVVISEPTTATL